MDRVPHTEGVSAAGHDLYPALRPGHHPPPRRPYDWDEKDAAWRNTGYLSPSLFINGSGGLLSCVRDLARWDAALYGEDILKQASLKQMWTPTRLGDGIVKNYGFGWDVEELQGHRRIGHSGGVPGFEAHIARFVDDRLTIIILTNLMRSNPWELSGVVAGMYEPALAPRKSTATSDNRLYSCEKW